MGDADPRSMEDLQRTKIVLEIEKLRLDLDRSNKLFRMEFWKAVAAFTAALAAIIGAAVGATVLVMRLTG